MKKILLSVCACITVLSSVNAQQKQTIFSSPQRLDNATVNGADGKERFKNNTSKKTRAGGSIFISYVDFVAAQEGISQTALNATGFLNNMFPDSVVRYGSPNSAYGINYKSIAQVLDPTADVIRDNTPAGDIYIGKTTAYKLDSIFVRTAYIKKTAAVDTIILSILHSGGANLPEAFFTNQASDFGVDTTRFLIQSYNPAIFTQGSPYQINAAGAPAPMIIKRALTASDSSTFTAPNSYGSKYIGFEVNMNIPAGEKVSMSYTFKPGFTYAVGDTIANNNQLLFLSYEPNGDNTFMPFYPTDRNMSSVINKDSSLWYGDYIPTLAWSIGYGPEIHDMFWKVSCTTCEPIGVNNVTDNGMMVNVTPNPASNNAKLSINLTESAKNVTVTLVNSIGQVVKTMDLGTVNANSTEIFNMNVSDLSKGMYMYTVNANGKKFSSKLVIN